jgi:ABC-type phosphate transport system substrate-binding protein
MKIQQRVLMALAILLAAPAFASAGIAVIAHSGVTTQALSAEQVSQLYLGRVATLPDGSRAVMLDLMEGVPLRAEFSERVLGKNEQQLRSYWTRLIFTGKGQPPRTIGSVAEMLRAVAATPGAIGYVDSGDVSGKVKVLLRIE